MEIMILAELQYDGKLSVEAIAILVGMLTLLIGGLSWCFYRAIKASETDEDQLPGEE